MSFVAPTGAPIRLGVAELPPAGQQRDAQSLQTFQRNGIQINPTEIAGEFASPLFLVGGCTQVTLIVESFTTADPFVAVNVYALPVCFSGQNAGKYYVDDVVFNRFYLPVGSLDFIPGSTVSYGAAGFSTIPQTRAHGMFALFFSPEDQIPWSFVLTAIGEVGRATTQ